MELTEKRTIRACDEEIRKLTELKHRIAISRLTDEALEKNLLKIVYEVIEQKDDENGTLFAMIYGACAIEEAFVIRTSNRYFGGFRFALWNFNQLEYKVNLENSPIFNRFTELIKEVDEEGISTLQNFCGLYQMYEYILPSYKCDNGTYEWPEHYTHVHIEEDDIALKYVYIRGEYRNVFKRFYDIIIKNKDKVILALELSGLE